MSSMRMKHICILLLLQLFLLASVRSWPVGTIARVELFQTVATFRNNWRRTGNVPFAGPLAFKVSWSFQTARNIYSSPVIDASGRIYFGSQDHHVYCLTPNGRIVWKFQTKGDVDSTPTIGPDQTLYIGSDDDHLYALDLEGKLKWRYNSGSDIRSSPLVMERNIVVFTNYSGQVHAVQNGQLLWKVDFSGGWSNSSPSYDEVRKILYVTTSGGMVAAISTAGTVLWQTHLYSRIQSGTVPLDRDGNIYVATLGGLHSFNHQGRRRFHLNQVNTTMSPAINNDNELVLIDRTGHYFRISSEGSVLVRRKVANNESAGSILVDSSNNMYFGSRDDHIYAIRPDGTVIFMHNFGRDVDSTPVLSPRGTLYFGADTGLMYAIDR